MKNGNRDCLKSFKNLKPKQLIYSFDFLFFSVGSKKKIRLPDAA